MRMADRFSFIGIRFINQSTILIMRLDPTYLHFITREELRILSAIEMGMRNHEFVTAELITKIGNLRGGETFKTIQRLLKNKLIVHIGNKCDGYKLTYLGYDFLALNTFLKRGLIKEVLSQIGVGKESDIYQARTPDGELVVLKLTRLGRTSFRSIKRNRDYIQNRTSYNWLYLSRLSSIREFLFMQLLHKNGFPVPKPIDTNRHAILMSLVDGDALCHVQRITTQKEIRALFEVSLNTLVKFAEYGLIHGDYNEFNLMVNADGNKLTVIDFPQCVSVNHPNAAHYFSRDVECVFTYFDKLAEKSYHENEKNRKEGDLGETKFNAEDYPVPQVEDIEQVKRLDHEIKTVGHITLQEYNEFEKYRSEEERMQAEMDGLQLEEEEGEEEGEGEGEEPSKQQLEREEAELNEFERKNEIENNDEMNIIEQIIGQKGGEKYDEELKNLIDDFEETLGNNQLEDKEGEESEEEEQEEEGEEEEEERFKGMTAYEVRMTIKEEKRAEKEKKKKALTTDEYIKKSLRHSAKGPKQYISRGNHGTKNKVKQTNLEIKDNRW